MANKMMATDDDAFMHDDKKIDSFSYQTPGH
jgi:hypothetical protein